ncbi:MAG TPA: recombinase family protein, partial [Nitriliruptorales bacterium]
MTEARTRRTTPPSLKAQTNFRVATLTRISTDEINQPYSLDAQATALEQFVASQPGMEITHRFVDQASGATLERPGLQQALDLARDGAFDVLLVYRIDRLTRSIVGLMTVVNELEAAGVALKSATEPIDTQGPVGRMVLQLLGIFAEFERNLLIDRITKGFARKAARGEWVGGRPPYGYRVDSETKTLAPEPDEATLVRDVFTKYADEHQGAVTIANWLNDTGRRTRHGHYWTGQTLLRMLRNPVYRGKIVHHDSVHDGKHDALVTPSLFERTQELLEERGQTTREAKKASQDSAATNTKGRPRSDYVLTGLVRCTACKGAFIGRTAHGRGGRAYRYYVCRTHKAKGARACTAPRLPADDVEDGVVSALLALLGDTDLIQDAIDEALAARRQRRPSLDEQL